MKKFYLCKLCLIVFGALLAVQSAVAQNWNKPTQSNGSLKENTSATLGELRSAFINYYQNDVKGRPGYWRYPSGSASTPSRFKFNLRENLEVESALEKTGLLSYLLFENDEIVIDEISPKHRLGDLLDAQNTKFNSQSVGKSFVSYVLGHAICRGYIAGLDHRLNDWPLIQNTLYYNQRLIDLINMTAGDGRFFKSSEVLISDISTKNVNSLPVSSWTYALKGTKAPLIRPSFAYNGFLSNLVNNYILHKTDGDYQKLINEIFVDKVKVRQKVFWIQQRAQDEEGPLRSTFFATRDDYLRIARSMLQDWKDNTCEGKYLKEIYERRVSRPAPGRSPFSSAAGYAGFFHTNFVGVSGTVFGMNGYGGQNVFINFDTGTIVSAHAVHQDYDWRTLILKAIRTR